MARVTQSITRISLRKNAAQDPSHPNLRSLHVLVTGGPTHEYIDDVRYLGNPSTGRMGMELARAAMELGANVTLVTGPTYYAPPLGAHLVQVVSAQDMLEAVEERFDECDVFIASAAVSDYRPAERFSGKMKKAKREITLRLVRNPDVLFRMGKRRKPGQTVVGFSLEAADFLKHARGKIEKKRCDLMVVNTPAHFGEAREYVRIIDPRGLVAEIPPTSKEYVADTVCATIARLRAGQKLPLMQAFAEPPSADEPARRNTGKKTRRTTTRTAKKEAGPASEPSGGKTAESPPPQASQAQPGPEEPPHD